jgi:group II intron reverse transcriptase/maturase
MAWWSSLFALNHRPPDLPDLAQIAQEAAAPASVEPNHGGEAGRAKAAPDKLKAQPPERWFTPAALRRAWLAVKAAKGGPGVDGISLQQFEANVERELATLRIELISGTYQPQPVRQVLVPKASVGMRPIAIWAIRDRVAQRATYDLIAPVFEATFLPCSMGFRVGYGVPDAVAALEQLRDGNLRWVVNADIQECFESIDSVRLLKLVAHRVQDRLLRHYIAGWLHAQILNSADGVPKRAGTSQGGVLSPLLANIYLHQFDQVVAERKLAYLRYADDFVICCRQKAEAEQVLAFCHDALKPLGLKLRDNKTQVIHFDQGFSWLGYFFLRRECFRL